MGSPSEHATGPVEIARGAAGRGWLDLVVGVGGAPEHLAAVDGVIEAFADQVGKVTLTRPSQGWTPSPERWPETDAADALSQAALFVSSVEPRLIVLPDDSPHALYRLVVDSGARLAVVLDAPDVATALEHLCRRSRIRVLGAVAHVPPLRLRPWP